MSGRWLTQKQVELYMTSRKNGKTQVASAAISSMSERSGREIEHDRRTDPFVKKRHWRTRKCPFEEVWTSELVPMLKKEPDLKPLTLLEYLQEAYGPELYPDNKLRTLQRRVRDWCYKDGPACEVIFRQEHEPGSLAFSDFTELKGIVVTIRGKPLGHLLYHFRTIYAGWSYMKVILGGESYTALAQGLQNALWRLGGVPKEHRTDSLSAAYKNLSDDEQQDLTNQYNDFCRHYNMKPSRNNKGNSHENGGIESPHGHLKRRISQAFLLRGSYDFDSVDEYQAWIEQVVNAHNRRNAKSVDVEKMALQPLPKYKTTDYSVLPVKVSSSSTIQVRTSLYTVPSKLIGATLQVHLYHDHLQCFYGTKMVATLERVYGKGSVRRAKSIDYRHVIDSLVKKPMAFYKSVHREALLPTEVYKNIWQLLSEKLASREASQLMVGILALAAKTQKEEAVGDAVMAVFAANTLPVLKDLQEMFGQKEPSHQYYHMEASQHDLSDYNAFIEPVQESSHAMH